jgi:glycosyltransferase involved in cell wall biosynthesis
MSYSLQKSKPLKVLYLLNREQKNTIEEIKRGESPDNHLYGILRLAKYDIEADYVEIEQIMPENVARFLRTFINIYWIHIFFFFTFLKYDVIFTSTAFGSQLVHALYPFKKPKWVMLDFSITGLLGDGTTAKQKLFHFLVKHADGIVAIDEHEAESLKKMFPKMSKRVQYIQFAVDTDFFKPQSSTKEHQSIFSPGRDPGRDFKTLFKAVKNMNIPVRITARPWNIKKLLPFPSFVLHKDLSIHELLVAYTEAAIVVVPLDTTSNINNSMGTSTIVEAMAMGKAIIATRTPAIESYIEDGVNGVLVPAQNVEALAAAIKDLLENPARRKILGENARRYAEEHCTAPLFAQELARYFKKLASDNRLL